jgi:feruloyl-CoA synthase
LQSALYFRLVEIEEHDVEAFARHFLGDAATHVARADDGERVKRSVCHDPDGIIGAVPYRAARTGDLQPVIEQASDGVVRLRAAQPLGEYPRSITDRLAHWAETAPRRTLLAWREGDCFAHLTYGDALARVRSVAQALLDRRLSAERPLAILSGNDVNHLVLALAAQYAGVLYAPVSPAYSLVSQDFGTLAHVAGVLTPGLVYAADARYAPALASIAARGMDTIDAADMPALLDTMPTSHLDRAHEAVEPDAPAKILFTSGSMGVPKGVVNTHRMLAANQQMILETLPFLGEAPPVLVDWLPWHHTFGGNHNIGITIYNGGSMYLDEGRPLPGLFDESVRNLRDVGPTVYFNVPRGYEELVKALARDRALAERFFSPRLRLLFYAAASLSQNVADELARIALETCGERLTLVTGLGSTETAPMAICRPWESPLAAAIGLPVPGVEVKLVPADTAEHEQRERRVSHAIGAEPVAPGGGRVGGTAGPMPPGKRYEVRVKGPNVTPGYWRDAGRTAAAFDDEGYYRMGDAVRFAAAGDPSQGLLFDGRLGEDFKLSTGTWVGVGALRARIIAHFAPYIRDAVVTGHDRDSVGMLAVPDQEACRRLCPDLSDVPFADVAAHPAVRDAIAERLATFARLATGSANRVERAILLVESLSLDQQEVTDKGSINQRAVLARRARLVEELYAATPDAHVIIGAIV